MTSQKCLPGHGAAVMLIPSGAGINLPAHGDEFAS